MGDLQRMSRNIHVIHFPIHVAAFHSLETDTALQLLRAQETYQHHVISIKVLTFGAAKL